MAQLFSCKFSEISKNTFSYRTPLVAASEFIRTENVFVVCCLFSKIKKNRKRNVRIICTSQTEPSK